MPDNPEDIIVVENLVKSFDDLTAVNGVSFKVKRGELFGILGPNGAGKTTTLEIIETLKKPSGGNITVDGVDIEKNPNHVKRIMGIQLQSAGFYPQLNLVELLNMFAAIYGVRVNPMEMLKKVQLEDKAKVFVDKLSGGQRQRFSIATTLVNKPRIIFLDEPTTGLDPQARINLWEMIREIQKSGVTIVLTTHYMDEAEQLCDRVAIMDKGKIIKVGSPHALISDFLKTGFKREAIKKEATLEDVFLNLTGTELRDE